MTPSLGNEHEAETSGATRPRGQVKPASAVPPWPKRAYNKPSLRRFGVLRSVSDSGVIFSPPPDEKKESWQW